MSLPTSSAPGALTVQVPAAMLPTTELATAAAEMPTAEAPTTEPAAELMVGPTSAEQELAAELAQIAEAAAARMAALAEAAMAAAIAAGLGRSAGPTHGTDDWHVHADRPAVGARAKVKLDMEQRWQKQVEKARKQLERECHVMEWDRECEEVGQLMHPGRERTTEESQRLHHLRPVEGMFADYGGDCGVDRRRKQAERYRKQDKHAVMAPNIRLAAEQKQAQMAQELELEQKLEVEQELEPEQELELAQELELEQELEQELGLGIESSDGTSSEDGQGEVFVDWRG